MKIRNTLLSVSLSLVAAANAAAQFTPCPKSTVIEATQSRVTATALPNRRTMSIRPTHRAAGSAMQAGAKGSMNKTRANATRGDIIQVAVGPGMQTVTTLVKAVQAAELVDALRGDGPFTVFAPTNDAFAKLPQETLERLLRPENRDRLRSILLYHVHAGEAIPARSLQDRTLTSLNGESLSVRVDGPTVMINDATVTKTDVIASNGVIHWIDTVLLPTSGGANGDQLTATDAPLGDIVETAVGPGMQTVTTLVKAVQAAGLVDALRGPGPFTVFAPTNDAFAKLPAGTIENLLNKENRDKLRAILLFHVHAGRAIPATELANGSISTIHGKPVDITVDGPTVMIENATITKTDVLASNGVIHWIDTVILP